MSKAVRQFEAAFATHQEAVAARAFWMGRIGLYALLRALGVGPGDAVGICSYTCLGVVEAVTRIRATPVFLDVDRHMNIAVSSLDGLTTRIKVLVLQHTFGVPCQLDASLAWAAKRGIPVIEDCCHALDARWEGKRVGCFGIGAIFGFEWGKPFSAGQGGLITFNDASLAHEVDKIIAAEAVRPTSLQAGALSAQRLFYRWLVTPRTRRGLRSVYRWASHHGLITGAEPKSRRLVGECEGFLRLFSDSQARAAHVELRQWPNNRSGRMEAARAIHERLLSEGIGIVDPDPRASPMYLRVPVWVESKQKVLAAAESSALDITGGFLSPAHPLQGEALNEVSYAPGSCPVAEEAFSHVVAVATRPAFTPAQLDVALRIIRGAV